MLHLAFGRYYWRELPQVSFLSQQKFCLDKHVCRDKTCLLLQQKYACRVVVTKTLFVVAKLCLSRQTRVHHEDFCCCDKHTFVTTKDLFCRDKHVFASTNVFVMTKLLS